MPTYDYRCPKCEKKFEARIPLAQRDEVACPTCATKPTVRLITGGNFLSFEGCFSNHNCESTGCGSGGCCG